MSARTAGILLSCLGVCATMGGPAAGETVKLVDKSLSATVARDGQSLTFGYLVSGVNVTSASLAANLSGPDGKVVADPGSDLQVALSSSPTWCYRDLLVNLAPGAATGLFDATWTVLWETSNQTSGTLPAALTIEPTLDVRCPILMYHKVGPVAHSMYWVTTSSFESHMKALKAYGYTTITLQQLMDVRAGLVAPPAKPILITFDDGYENNLTEAYPILARPDIDFNATLFLPTGRVGGTNIWDGDRDPVINHLTWSQVQILHDSGRFDIQSHTVSHPDMPDQNDADLQHELTDSRQEIQTRLNKTVRYVSWPYGANDLRTQNAAHEAGYFAAIAATGDVEPNCQNKWALKRVGVYRSVTVDSTVGDFLMQMIDDPDVLEPVVRFGETTYLDPATNLPLVSNQLRQGDPVKIRLRATNWGPDAPVKVTLRIDDGVGTVYNSHETVPAEDLVITFGWGWRNFEWTWRAPADARPGGYSVAVEFHDPYYVLAFGNSGVIPAFTVIPASIVGDVNGDGHVDSADLLYVASTFGLFAGDAGFDARCDFNSDNSVDVIDLLMFVDNFGKY